MAKLLSVAFIHRCLGTALTILIGLALMHFTAAGGLPGLVADLRDCQTRQEELAQHERQTVVLDDRLAISVARSEVRLSLLAELVAKRRTLRETCAEYRQVIGEDERFDRMLLAITSGADDSERLANYLLTSLVRGQVVDPATRDRLSGEFEREFGHAPDFRNSPSTSYPLGHPSSGTAPLLLAPESAHCP